MKISTFFDIPCKVNNKALSKFIYKINKVIVNFIYPLTVKIDNGIDPDSNVIVSLTSFPERIDTVWITVSTLLKQTMKPKCVILWLSDDQFPNREGDLPEKLLNLRAKGLMIKFCENIYPHKKYYYTMLENPDCSVITTDDDVFYPETFVEDLVETSRKYPDTICCTWAHEIKLENGKVARYADWVHGVKGGNTPSTMLMPVGCGGVLYPPHSLDSRVFDLEDIKTLCIKTDDLWLKCMALIKGTKAVRIDKPSKIYFTILKTQKVGLHYENVGENKNDVAMMRIVERYPQILSVLKENQ